MNVDSKSGKSGGQGSKGGKGRMKQAPEAERRVARAAQLLLSSEVLPGPAPLPDFERLLARGRRGRSWALILGGMSTAAALMLLTIFTFQDRAVVSYVVDGPIAISGDVIEAIGTVADGASRLRFSEGTQVDLTRGSRMRVARRNASGAALLLERGHAGLAVTHRRGAHWSVATGPFTVDVTGTRFSVDWSPERSRMVVELTEGKVSVRGASVGGPVEMHAGERLVATVADHRVTLSPIAGGNKSAGEASRSRPGGGGAQDLRAQLKADNDPDADVPEESVTAPAPAKTEMQAEIPAALKPAERHAPLHRRELLALASPSRPAARAAVAGSPAGDGNDPARNSVNRGLLGPAAPTPPSVAAPRPSLQPPVVAAPVSPTTTLGGGGVFCSRETAQYRFEQNEEPGISAASVYTLALANPERDTTHSWCGEGSVRYRANFSEQGRRNYFGRFLRETGQMVIRLDRPTDFTGRTVTMHVFVEGPSDARFSAEVFVVHRGHWVGSEPMRELAPGRWWTIKHTFTSANPTGGPESSNPQPYPGEGLSPVSDCNRVSLAIRSTGARRNWTGSVYVDDVGWR